MKTFSISSNQDTLGTEPAIGTLLWIGERDAPDFCDAYRYCEASSSQIAFRPTLDDARCRPASDVQRIVVARLDRSQLSPEGIELVSLRHANVSWLALEGPLCGGATRRWISTWLRTWLPPPNPTLQMRVSTCSSSGSCGELSRVYLRRSARRSTRDARKS